jgi:deoxycytidylate deaminase
MSWDEKFLALAKFWADTCSKDPRTKVGAVLTASDKRRMSLGYNGFPPGVADTPERLADRSTKHKLTMHAERNALDNALFDVRGGTMYVTMFPCSECAKSIASRGIKRVACPPPVPGEPWASDAPWTRLILSEGGVLLDEIQSEGSEPGPARARLPD